MADDPGGEIFRPNRPGGQPLPASPEMVKRYLDEMARKQTGGSIVPVRPALPAAPRTSIAGRDEHGGIEQALLGRKLIMVVASIIAGLVVNPNTPAVGMGPLVADRIRRLIGSIVAGILPGAVSGGGLLSSASSLGQASPAAKANQQAQQAQVQAQQQAREQAKPKPPALPGQGLKAAPTTPPVPMAGRGDRPFAGRADIDLDVRERQGRPNDFYRDAYRMMLRKFGGAARGTRRALPGVMGVAGGLGRAAMGALNHEQETAGGAIGGMMSSAGSMAMMAGGPAGMVTGGLLKLGGALFSAVDKLREWSANLHRSNMQFADYSGKMASVEAQAEVRRIQYMRERGDARAGSADRLSRSMDRLNRATAAMDDRFANMKNNLAAWANEGMADFFETHQGKRKIGEMGDAGKLAFGLNMINPLMVQNNIELLVNQLGILNGTADDIKKKMSEFEKKGLEANEEPDTAGNWMIKQAMNEQWDQLFRKPGRFR